MKATQIDKKFDENKEEILDYFDTSKVRMVNKSINLNLPDWMITSLKKEAKSLDVNVETVIKLWIAEKLRNLNY